MDGETLFSLLSWQEEELQRGDQCSACFEEKDLPSVLYWWRTKHSTGKTVLRLDLDSLLALFASLEGEVDESKSDFRFLLALLLVRHRKLRLTRVLKRGAREFLELRKVRTKKVFEVEVRTLSEERRASMSSALSGLMDPTGEEADLGALLEAEDQGA